jgi:phenylacetate-CoA ligase
VNPAERLSRPELEALQLSKLRQAVDRALKTPHYRAKYADSGIRSGADIKTLADIRKLPFTVKNDLRDAFPDGLKAVPQSEIVRMHASSGTTGVPTVIYYTQADIERWAELGARSAAATGCDSGDVFQNMMSYGLFTGGLGLHYAAEKLGMMVIPVGGGNTQRQIKLMKDFGTTVVHATPSYLLHVHERLAEFGVSRSELKLKRAFVGAEPHTEEIRCKLEALWGIEVFNSYGLSEMNGPCVAFECVRRSGMHLWEDAYLMEVIDPDSGEVLPEGAEGELVLTNLDRQATPLLRYRTRDLTSIIAEPCACGRTHRRICRIKGRSDDMLIINGVNVFPSQIEEVVMKTTGLGSNYQILVRKDGALDQLIVKLELDAPHFSDDMRELEAFRHRIAGDLQTSISIKPRVELHEPGVLPVSEGKAVRVVDERPKQPVGDPDGCR